MMLNDVGALVHSGNQLYKTATGFYMVNFKPGCYEIRIVYKSPVPIKMSANLDWQTAILQVVWAEDANSVSDSIKCSPTTTATNAYNNWGPLKGVEATLYLPSNRPMLSAYQFSAEMPSAGTVVTALGVDGLHQHTASYLNGRNVFLDLRGAWAGNARAGIYYFTIQYRTPFSLSFTDCKYNVENNTNLRICHDVASILRRYHC